MQGWRKTSVEAYKYTLLFPNPMKVLNYIMDRLEREKMHMTLIDPDKQSALDAGNLAKIAGELGTDAIMVGGSTGVTQKKMDETIIAIKENVNVPVIIFPTSAAALSKYADAIYFMSLLNSKSPVFLVRQQMLAAPYIKKSGIEPISMGYIVVEPGMKVGEVGMAEPVPRDKVDIAVGYALAAELFGMKLVYLEAGSGAPQPVPPEMITAVKKELDIPLIVGGGIRGPESARNAVEAGADIVVTGTIVEEADDLEDTLGRIIEAVKS